MARIEFPLAQGWCRGLTIHFEDAETSRALTLDETFLYLKQVHGKGVHVCSASDVGRKSPVAEADAFLADAQFLKSSGKKILIQTADCLPLVFVEREQQKVMLIHAGWRGLVQNLHLRPFRDFGFRPESTWVWVGPSLNGANFEVGEDVWKNFPSFASVPEVFAPHELPEKRYFYVWNYLERLYSSLRVELVYQSEVDTYTDTSFASYRRSRKSGVSEEGSKARNYSWISFA